MEQGQEHTGTDVQWIQQVEDLLNAVTVLREAERLDEVLVLARAVLEVVKVWVDPVVRVGEPSA